MTHLRSVLPSDTNGIFLSSPSRFIGTRLSSKLEQRHYISELEKVKVMRMMNHAPPQLHPPSHYKLTSSHFPNGRWLRHNFSPSLLFTNKPLTHNMPIVCTAHFIYNISVDLGILRLPNSDPGLTLVLPSVIYSAI